MSDKTLLFRRRSIEKLPLCVKGKRVTICGGFELFHAGNVALGTRISVVKRGALLKFNISINLYKKGFFAYELYIRYSTENSTNAVLK